MRLKLNIGKLNFDNLALLNFLFLSCIFYFFATSSTVIAQPIIYLNNTNAPPYTTENKDGYIDLIAGEAFRRAGYELHLVQQPAERGLINANGGKIDGDLTRIKGLEVLYPNLVRISEKLFDWEFVAFSKTSSSINDWQSIYDHPVGYIKGWKIYEKKLDGAKLVTIAGNAEQLFRLLTLDRVESILYERWQGLALMQKAGLQKNALDIHTIEKREMYIYLNENHSSIVTRVAEELRKLKSEGFYQRVFDKTLAPYNLGSMN